jgi:4-hydroxybenzoate polyprenyltransferase
MEVPDSGPDFSGRTFSMWQNPSPVLVVDLDGTLVKSDMLFESAWQKIVYSPWKVFSLLLGLVKGKANLKADLAQGFTFSTRNLPFRPEVLDAIAVARSRGSEVVLATASNEKIARKVALDLEIFDAVMASTRELNLAGHKKAKALVVKFGEQGFDYIGDSSKDLPVWQLSKTPILVGSNASAIKSFNRLSGGVRIKEDKRMSSVQIWSKALRFHQWVKNLLLFVPALAAYRILELNVLASLALAFLAFGFLASAVYLINDLSDIENDRAHQSKRFRPIASGELSIPVAGFASIVLLMIASFAGVFVGIQFVLVLLGYFVLTITYTFLLKKLLIIDVVTLAVLYTLRVVAGGVAVGIPVSFWLLAFSFFIFLSLSFLKRASELGAWEREGRMLGRAYLGKDLPTVTTLGLGSGLLSVLVFALYLEGDSVSSLYQNPILLWGAVPLITFWVSWVWMKLGRGEVDQDPILFALRDRVSLVSGLLLLSLFLVSHLVTTN